MLTKNTKVIDNKLFINNFSCETLAKTYKTPLYVIDEKHLLDILSTFETTFKSTKYNTHLVYASKAFISFYLNQILNERNWHIDATSLGDMEIINKSGFSMSNVLLHGNNKSELELEYASNNQVTIVVDNLEELKKLVEMNKSKKINTFFRINPGIEAHTHEYIQTSLLASKFGESIYDEKVLNEIMTIYQNNQNIKLLGFHSHIGSQILSPDSFLLNLETMVNLTIKLQNEFNYQIDSLNIGGGFGITYTNESVDVKFILQKIINKMDTLIEKTSLTDIYIEPGRSIIAPCSFTLYEAGITKTTYGGKKYLFIDGGMPDNIRPALYQAKYDVINASCVNEEQIKVDVVGKCCESGDIIAKDIYVSKANPKDIIMIPNTLAYGYTMSSNYNSALKPAVISVNEEIKEVIKRESLTDLYHLFK